MKKLITSLFVLMAIVFSSQGQTFGSYNQFRYTSTAGVYLNQDTAYVMLQCRAAQYQGICSSAPGVLKAVACPATFDPGDSLVWRVIKGASIGTIPTVRFMNVRTGEFLYQGLNGGAATVAYVAPNIDPNNGNKDFSIVEQGTTGTFYCYYIEDMANGGLEFANTTAGAINLKSATSAIGWKFILKKGPQPKAIRYTPTVAITTSDVISIVGGTINLDIQVTKGANDLLGSLKLYHNKTLITTLPLDANGHATYIYPGLVDGVESFTAAYTGDSYYDPENATVSVSPVANPAALNTKVLLDIPATSEFSKDAKLNIAVQTTAGDVVVQGNVYVYVNGIKKNRVAVDALGLGSITFNNLLVGTTNIKAMYVGDKMAYLNSDTTRVSTEITPTTSSVKPYPVYFDLSSQPVIDKWASLYIDPLRPAGITHVFPQDSVPGITMDSLKYNITYLGRKWGATGVTIAVDDQYPHSNSITLPMGSGRAQWFNIKTPWLNEGSYNVYVDSRVNSTGTPITITDVTLDGKSGYFPNEDMTGRWFRAYGNCNRRWNAVAHGGNNGMAYIGTVNAAKSDLHNLKVFLKNENGADIPMGMMQFIPVEMDSLKITQTSAVNLAKVYYPLFDLGGFARQAGEAGVAIYADITALAIPYQVTDQTTYTKTPYVIDTLGNERTTFSYVDYVIVYRKDKWTRMAEGPVDTSTKTFTCDLPDGEYYYQELDFYASDVVQATGRRTVVKEGAFTVGSLQAVNTQKESKIKAYGYNKILTVKGLKAGAKILVTDLTGKIVVNSISTSDVFTKTLNPSIYVIQVISENDVLRTKVLVK